MINKKTASYTWFDWNHDPIYNIKIALRSIGIHVYEDPIISSDGSTCRGLVFSKDKLDKKSLRKFCRKMWNNHESD